MTEKIIARYLDEDVEISTEHLLNVVFEIEGKRYTVQREFKGKELQISVDSQLVIHPRATNMVLLKIENW